MSNQKNNHSIGKPESGAASGIFGDILITLLIPFLPIMIGLVGVCGWVFDVPTLKSIIPGAVEMKVNTAIGLIFSGTALFILSHPPMARFKSIALLGALIIGLTGLATLLEYAFTWNLGMDEWLFNDQAKAFNRSPGRMSPYTAVSFVLLGSSLIFSAFKKRYKWISILALTISGIGAISFLSYFWNAIEFTTDRWAPPVAVHTACALLLLGLGIFRINQRKVSSNLSGKKPKWSIENKVLSGFIFALLLLLTLGGYTYRSMAEYAQNAQWLEHTQKVLTAISELQKSITEAEATQRNYIITGMASQLIQYQRLVSETRDQHALLVSLVTDNPAQLRNLENLRILIDQRFDGLSAGIKIFEEQGLPSVSKYVATGRGIDIMDTIRKQSQKISKIEEGLWNERQAAFSSRRVLTLISLLITLTAATGIMVSLYFAVRREMAARSLAESSLVSSNRFLDSIFENIPSMIFIKEARELRYVQLNRAGEELLGISRSDLIGKNYFDFYRKEKAEVYFARDQQILKEDRIHDIPEEAVYVRNKGKRLFHTIRIPLHDAEGNATFLLGMTEDITVRRQAEDQIKALNVELTGRAAEIEASNKELESFSYSISHDLRAPLRHIQGYVQMLLDSSGNSLQTEPRRYLDVIAKSAKQMGELIDNLLNFSRMSRTLLHEEKVELATVIKEVISSLEMMTRNRNIEWNIHHLPPVNGDQAMLKQVLVNLISNAIKYSSPRDIATIEVGVKEQNGPWISFYVKDNGVGFEMQYASKLFGVFQRLHRVDEFEGTGIGLANVQRIINRHGGRIWAEAELNKGACFYFTLKSV